MKNQTRNSRAAQKGRGVTRAAVAIGTLSAASLQLLTGSAHAASTAIPSADQPNQHAIYSYLGTHGLTAVEAAAVVGNLQVESGGDPAAGEGSAHQGIVQWSSGRWANVQSFATSDGVSAYALLPQEQDVVAELTGPYASVLSEAAACGSNVDCATQVIFSDYEIPGDASLPTRQGYAEWVSSNWRTAVSYQLVFDANVGRLWSDPGGDSGQPMAAGSSAAAASLASGGVETAFAASNGMLTLRGPSGALTTLALGVAGGTSPAIAASSSGGFEVAFTAAGSDDLWTYSSATGKGADSGSGLQAGTSPSIAALSGGGYELAAQTNVHNLLVLGPAQDFKGLGLLSGTSPAVAAAPSGNSFEVAFQANTGVLWTYSPAGGGVGHSDGLKAGTSPAIAALSTGAYEVAAQTNTSKLMMIGPVTAITTLGMDPASSPSVAAGAGGTFEMAFNAAGSGDLWTYTSAGVGANTGQGMKPGTSPDISSGAIAPSGIASLASANVGDMACSTNSLGGSGFATSCTGAGGQPELWCADFARWDWANNGVADTAALNGKAASFYAYGNTYGTLTSTPAVGDAAVFSPSNSTGDIQHVAIVIGVSGGDIHTISGDWGGSGSGVAFASSSHVADNGSYSGTVGGYPAAMGLYLMGYVAPVK